MARSMKKHIRKLQKEEKALKKEIKTLKKEAKIQSHNKTADRAAALFCLVGIGTIAALFYTKFAGESQEVEIVEE